MKPTATITEIEVEVVAKVPGVVLTMSIEQAKSLMALSRVVGGDPTETRRGDIDAIRSALESAYVDPMLAPRATGLMEGGVCFLPERKV